MLTRLLSSSYPRLIAVNSTLLPTKRYLVRTFHTIPCKMVVHEVKNMTHFEESLSQKKAIILDTYATWCGPCKTVAPTVERFSEQYPQVHFMKVNIEKFPELADKLNTSALPSFYFFKDGKYVSKIVGAKVTELEKAILTIIDGKGVRSLARLMTSH